MDKQRPFDQFLLKLKWWQIGFLAVLITQCVVIPLSFYFHNRLTVDYLITGVVASVCASAFIVPLIASYVRALKRAHTQLEKRVKERTQALESANTQLLQEINEREKITIELAKAKAQAEEANELKSSFLSTMSHEIRTPLNGMIGLIELLKEVEHFSPAEQKYLRLLNLSSQTLLELVNDVLDLAKLESGDKELFHENFDLYHLCESCINMMRPPSVLKAVDIRLEWQTALPKRVSSDEIRLKQLLTNLLSNAVKYTDEGEIVLKVEEISDENHPTRKIRNENQLSYLFTVSDTGLGIESNDQKYIFGRFNQVRQNRSGSLQGTGLGLTICQEIIKLFDGEIGLESEHGSGSKFWFSVNIEQAESSANRSSDSSKDSKVVPISKPKRQTSVLVAEDNEVNQHVMKGLLNKFGCHVDIAGNGEEALSKLRTDEYDIVFMDCIMPIMDGFEATTKIRENNSEVLNKNIPVIAVTANILHNGKQVCLNSGMNDYISKPINKNELQSVLERWTA